MDWWVGQGGTPGNKALIDISRALRQWLQTELGLSARPVPYYVEKGGLFLKDAAVLAGLGVIGASNLLITPRFGPRVRLRAVHMDADLPPSTLETDFQPCETCPRFCRQACPVEAFESGSYDRPSCQVQMQQDESSAGQADEPPTSAVAIRYCRECELACPVGSGNGRA